MKSNNLTIWRDAVALLVAAEQAVCHFPQHKYSLGAEIRAQGMKICQLINRVWRDKALVWRIV